MESQTEGLGKEEAKAAKNYTEVEHPADPQPAPQTNFTSIPLSNNSSAVIETDRPPLRPAGIDPRFLLPEFTVRQKVFKLFGGDFDVLDPENKKILFAHQESLAEAKPEHKWRTRIHLYPSAKETRPEQALLHIATDKKFDWGIPYEVTDGNGRLIGYLKNRPVKSLLWADKWEITNDRGELVGNINEIGAGMRFITEMVLDFLHIPLPLRRKFEVVNLENQKIASLVRQRNPIVDKIKRHVHQWDPKIDPRLLTAGHLLLSAFTHS